MRIAKDLKNCATQSADDDVGRPGIGCATASQCVSTLVCVYQHQHDCRSCGGTVNLTTKSASKSTTFATDQAPWLPACSFSLESTKAAAKDLTGCPLRSRHFVLLCVFNSFWQYLPTYPTTPPDEVSSTPTRNNPCFIAITLTYIQQFMLLPNPPASDPLLPVYQYRYL